MRAPSDLSAETRRILALAWPVALTSLNWTILQVTDIVVVGLTGTSEVAAFAASRTLIFVTIMIGIGSLSGVLVQASRAEGAGETARSGQALHDGLVLGLALGACVGIALGLLALPMLTGIGVAGETAPRAARVVQVMALAYPFQLVTIAASFFLEGVSRPRRVMAVNLAALPLNALLAWGWSGGHLGLPHWGAVGAASATAAISAMTSLAMLGAAWTLPDAAARGIRAWRRVLSRETLRGARRLLAFGIVPALASGLELAGFSILIALSTRLGDAAAHAFAIVFAVHNVTFGVAIGLGSAAGVRVGNAVGEGRPERALPRALIAAGLSALATGTLAALVILGRGVIAGAFPAAPEVHRLALAMLPVWAPFILFDGLQVVFVYALRSLGDQIAAGLNSILAFFLITGGTGLLLVFWGWGPLALVFASGSGMVVSALLNGSRLARVSRRFRSRS